MTNDTRPRDPKSRTFCVGDWLVDPATGRLAKHGETVPVEPKVMDLLVLLAGEPGRVFSRSEIEEALWANTVVGEDTVARTVSRLRRALGDSAQAPSYIETFPKRGYRLVAATAPAAPGSSEASPEGRSQRIAWRPKTLAALLLGVTVVVASFAVYLIVSGPDAPTATEADTLTNRAGDLYMRFTRADNEAAIVLYERALAADQYHAGAQAGLANALVQRIVRWPHPPGSPAAGADSLADALQSGLTRTADARETLARATAMAERAVRLSPRDSDALKALGLTLTAQGEIDRAEEVYRRAVAIDEDAWESLINLGEIYQMRQDRRGAVEFMQQAYAAMERSYAYEPQRTGPWKLAVGVAIGTHYEALQQPEDAELWYRRVLAEAPLEPEATTRLAMLLSRSGERGEALRLCRALKEKVGSFPGCALGEGSDTADGRPAS
ncbi:MAG: winged helix-turn-helix domain-containing protein [Pseudomonadota bacterium]